METSPGRTRRIRVDHAHGSYDVVVGEGELDRLGDHVAEAAPAHRYAVISDDTVAGFYGDRALAALASSGLRAELFRFAAGEASKSRAMWARLTDELLGAGFGRDSAVVALGGGVTGDLAGFVAATFMRGVPVIQVPTSLVAMIDASVGGKTGVDTRAGKNLVGVFHAPRRVVADSQATGTLPVDERRQGLAEALKHGAILDERYFSAIVENAGVLLEGSVPATTEAVHRSVELKAEVVLGDERERGRRQVLNFGHTIGHALEAASEYRLGHGTAVAWGMVAEAFMGERVGVTAPGTSQKLRSACERLGFPRPSGIDPDAAARFLAADKKSRGGRPRFVLLERVGCVASDQGWSREVQEAVVKAAFGDVLDGG